MSSGVRGIVGALDRIDLDDDHVPAGRLVEQRPEGRIADVAAVPIGLFADLHRLEQLRQAGRGHDVVGGQNVAAKDLAAAGPDVGGRDEQFRRVERTQALEVDERGQMVEQRIEIERVERVRAGELRHRLHPPAEKRRSRPDHAPGLAARRRSACAEPAQASPPSRRRARTFPASPARPRARPRRGPPHRPRR